jgi:Cu2+-exporting ATPase
LEQFCCAGCEAVWNVLHQCGLEEYYRLRASYEVHAASPASISGKSFDYLDDPEFLNAHSTGRTQGGIRFTFYLDGIHCVACSWLIEKVLIEREGAAYACLNLGKSTLDLVFDPTQAKLSALARALDRLGYTPHVLGNESAADAARKETRRLIARMGIAGACAGNIMLLAVSTYFGEYSGMDAGVASLFRWISLGLAIPAVTYSAWPFYKGAWYGLRHRALHMDLPISLGIIAAFAISLTATLLERGEVYFDSVSMLVFLLLAGRLVLYRAGQWAASASENLLQLEPKTARRLEHDTATVIPLADVQLDDKLQVLPGEAVPVDGLVIEGLSYVAQAHLTGEPTPLRIEPGDTVFAGSVTTVSPFVMMATQVGESTRLHRLAEFMREAALRRAPITALTDRIAGYFVAAVLLLATLTGIYWYVRDPSLALWNCAAMLVVTCPCALGLATPIALAIAMGRAARRGIFIKGADGVERLASVQHVILDKTGTITHGQLSLVAQHYLTSKREEQLQILSAVAAIEAQSGHIYSRAFREQARPSVSAIEITTYPGAGIVGSVNGHCYTIGSAAFMQKSNFLIPQDFAEQAAATTAGQSHCFAAQGGQIVALFILGDRAHAKSRAAIAELRQQQLTVELLSGDSPAAVAQIAQSVKVTVYQGGVSPEQKLERVCQLQANGTRVAMVGDGINDSAALSAATVGISPAGAAEIARNAADVFISGRGPDAIAEALALAKRALRVIKINIAIGIAYNVVGATLAFTGMVSPLSAAILMPLSSLTVLLIASRA